MQYVIFTLIAVTITVMGQLFIKKGLNLLGDLDFSSGFIRTYSKIFISPYVILGFSIYVVSIFVWLYVLSKVDLSFAYPFLAFSYVLVILFSLFFLGETISLIRWAGVVLICFGIIFVSRS
ncbi:multidrug resistance protein [Desulfobacteraceae bacterium SEEP-SAG9]|nr:multidrug resistance protein [Desulfobacteraceae bacterium SEEP-SAG9]